MHDKAAIDHYRFDYSGLVDQNQAARKAVFEAARRYCQAGLSFIPIKADGSKMPAFELLPRVWCNITNRFRRPWSPYKTRLPTKKEVRAWFRDSPTDQVYGIAIIGGAVSGGVEIIDIDNWETAQPWMDSVEKAAPGLLGQLVRVQSPRPGMHIYYRCADPGRNEKLAQIPVPDPATGKTRPKTVIELKGEAGYCLAPPSPEACHPTRRPYVYLSEIELDRVPTITKKQRDILIACARQFDQFEKSRPERTGSPWRSLRTTSNRPGDDFNVRGDWGEILEPHGWRCVGTGGDGIEYWRRPGKKDGHSATTGYQGSHLFRVFSSNAAPFEPDTSYTKFQVCAMLDHNGDFGLAARALRKAGFGKRFVPVSIKEPALDRYSRFQSASFSSRVNGHRGF